jgi:hypothetical protein
MDKDKQLEGLRKLLFEFKREHRTAYRNRNIIHCREYEFRRDLEQKIIHIIKPELSFAEVTMLSDSWNTEGDRANF